MPEQLPADSAGDGRTPTDLQEGAASAVPHPVDDVPQTFLPGGSYDVRDRLGDYISRDLLGPWGGDLEELPRTSRGPRDEYLVGMLGPKPAPLGREAAAQEAAQSTEAEPGNDGDARDAELPERLTPQAAGRIWASSMGLSFVVPAFVGVVSVTASWGRYSQSESLTEDGRTGRAWSRRPVSHQCDVSVADLGDQSPQLLEGDGIEGPHVRLEVKVRRRTHGPDGEDLRVVEVALVNALDDSPRLRDANWLFQTRLEVCGFPDGAAAVFLPIDDPLTPGGPDSHPEDPEERRLRLLHRDQLRHAIGRNVAVHAEVRKGERNAYALATTWLPEYDVPATTAPSLADQPLLAGLELSMDALAGLAVPERRKELAAVLQPLSDGYFEWLGQQRERAAALPDDLRASAEAAITEAEDVCHRIALGIDTLGADPVALEAFRFANLAMALQRRNTAVAAERTAADGSITPYADAAATVRARGAAAASWRPFQLAFVLLNLASLTEPGHPHRGTGREALVDLLFFPTGGGKTEAYLGLAAYAFALRRLQGVVGSGSEARSGEAGVAVLMRYTLRLLTAQQFQRAAALVCATEVLRRQAWKAGDRRWGDTPFRIGLWVGNAVSPNWYTPAAEQIAEAREAGDGKRANVLQVLGCPWCGEGLRAHRDLAADDGRRRILLYCPRGEGEDPCPFSRRSSPGEGLPILTVDEEIYRLAPSLLIATVDKLAQLPWRGYAGLLFGRVTELCPRHGYRHADLDSEVGCGGRHQARGGGSARGGLDAVTSRPVTRLRPPDLIIQDELHLISGALGTTVGLFESAVDQLCSWEFTGPDGMRRSVGPKIVASTATTKRAGEQVLGVFGRKVAVFPPQVVDAGDTFFSRQVPLSKEAPGRRYLGVCAHGVRLKAAEIRLAEILLRAGQELFDQYGRPADPYMTLVGYFNATRELAGMRRYLDDDVTTRVRVRKGRYKEIAPRILSSSGMLTVQELTSRVSSGDISLALKRLEAGFDQERETTVRRRAFMEEYRDALGSKPPRRPRAEATPDWRRAVDVVLATSMLQVGVDVSRFGLMLVVGQPKNTAEYIQASSRVGRDAARPGLVVTLYNWSRPRDLAHFEDFEHYHATFYRQVEALSVTPYTRRALDRGTASTYVAALRHVHAEHSRNADAGPLDLDGPLARRVEQRMLQRAEAVGGERARDYLQERIDALKDRWDEKRENTAALGYTGEKRKDRLLVGLLDRADGGPWGPLTVANSMRETENEINLLLPGGGALSGPPGPGWRFAPPEGEGAAADGTDRKGQD